MYDPWWKNKSTPGLAVTEAFQAIRGDDEDRADAQLRYMELYQRRYMGSTNKHHDASGTGTGYGRYGAEASLPGKLEYLNRNVIASIVDTLVSKIGKIRPRIKVLPSGGDYTHKSKCRTLEKYIAGIFRQSDIYKIARSKSFRMACVAGTGIIKVFREGSSIKAESVLPTELWVNRLEAKHGDPRTMYQVKQMPRSVLAAMFPKHKSAIENISASNPGEIITAIADTVEVLEAWHLPSSKKAKDGRHMMTLLASSVVLQDLPWEKERFPFIFMRYLPALVGFWGQGVTEILESNQRELDSCLRQVQDSIKFCSAPFWRSPTTANVDVDAIMTNEIGRWIEYDGQIPPDVQVVSTLSPDLVNHCESTYANCFELIGMTQLSAAGAKPSGLDAAVALQEYLDVESERFQELQLDYQEMFMDAAKYFVDLAKEISAEDPDWTVDTPGRGFMEKVRWSDIDLKEDLYEIEMYPTSGLPQRPEGRKNYVIELRQAGAIDQETMLQLLDMPDLEKYSRLRLASREVVEQAVERIIEDGEPQTPEPSDNLEYALEHATQVLQLSKLDKAPEENMDLLRSYIENVTYLIQQAMPPPPPAAAPVPEQGADPGAVPQQPPVSGLLPV